ncbi:hypothetical protein [Paeniglutamicibacter psychrophenolicus]|uniref:hypothetical protein n=1 Tax=Paeniglutamicibacter psychrophenolicus TaxID=257454 RepID=UPI002789FE9A|nr:hypothetical protein [Paeniglutamicibacter psychrophenolicus]MDQ0095097.1 hypothetical protein [Paeniglutamicibacter psychrophenolicus]
MTPNTGIRPGAFLAKTKVHFQLKNGSHPNPWFDAVPLRLQLLFTFDRRDLLAAFSTPAFRKVSKN